jgi:hypothetical protein
MEGMGTKVTARSLFNKVDPGSKPKIDTKAKPQQNKYKTYSSTEVDKFEDALNPSKQEIKEVTQNVHVPTKALMARKPTTSIAEAAFAMIKATGGAKNSERLVAQVQGVVDTLSTKELWTLFWACKRFSLDPRQYGDIFDKALTAGTKNLEKLGMNPTQIDKSKPRIEFINQKKDMDGILAKFVRACEEKALTWGSVMRTTQMEYIASKVRTENVNFKPSIPRALYSNAYWMVADFGSAAYEMRVRITLMGIFMFKTVNACTLSTNVQGKVEKIDQDYLATKNLLQDEERVDEKGNLILQGQSYSDVTDFSALKKVVLDMNEMDIADCAILPDVRKLLQVKTIRIIKDNPEHVNAVDRMIIQVLNFMKIVILMSVKFLEANDLGKYLKMDEYDANSDSEFTKGYYTAYQRIHMYTRSYKRLRFGVRGGADTRSAHLKGLVGKDGFDDLYADVFDGYGEIEEEEAKK